MKAARVLWQALAALAVVFVVACAAAPETDFVTGSGGWWSNFTVLVIGLVVLTPLLFAALVVTVVHLWRRRSAARLPGLTCRPCVQGRSDAEGRTELSNADAMKIAKLTVFED